MEHQSVKAPEKRCEGFAGACGGEDERIFSARDDRPTHPLRGGGRIKDSAKPIRSDRVKAGERVGIRTGIRIGVGPVARHASLRITHGEEEAKERISTFVHQKVQAAGTTQDFDPESKREGQRRPWNPN
jgi:hypothetical protein